jgi:hypothetical protein
MVGVPPESPVDTDPLVTVAAQGADARRWKPIWKRLFTQTLAPAVGASADFAAREAMSPKLGIRTRLRARHRARILAGRV